MSTQRVLDVMTRTVAVAHTEDPFPELVRLMREFRVSALPVLDADRVIIGIVSESDLLLREELELLDPAPASAQGAARRNWSEVTSTFSKSSWPRGRSLRAAVFDRPSRTLRGPIRVDWPNIPSPDRADHVASLLLQ